MSPVRVIGFWPALAVLAGVVALGLLLRRQLDRRDLTWRKAGTRRELAWRLAAFVLLIAVAFAIAVMSVAPSIGSFIAVALSIVLLLAVAKQGGHYFHKAPEKRDP